MRKKRKSMVLFLVEQKENKRRQSKRVETNPFRNVFYT